MSISSRVSISSLYLASQLIFLNIDAFADPNLHALFFTFQYTVSMNTLDRHMDTLSVRIYQASIHFLLCTIYLILH